MMDNPSMEWLPPELEIEEHGNNIIKQGQQTRPYYSDSMDSFSSDSFKDYNSNLVTINESLRLAKANSTGADKQQDSSSKATKISPFVPSHASSSNSKFTISFGKQPTSPQQEINQFQFNGEPSVIPKLEETSSLISEFLFDGTTRYRTTRRNHRQAQEHVLAERKRREKLAERFLSLSTLLPGLKKMDKATVLEDASKYIIQLQTRVKELEGTTSFKGKEIVHESVVSIRPGSNKVCGRQEDVASSDDICYLPAAANSSTNCPNPEIKARIFGSKILVRIYCRKTSSLVLKTLTEMERLQVNIIACSVLPFTTAHLITITAQYCMLTEIFSSERG